MRQKQPGDPLSPKKQSPKAPEGSNDDSPKQKGRRGGGSPKKGSASKKKKRNPWADSESEHEINI